MANEVYRVNGPRVIFENIDGELILVHMERGTYYSTDTLGAEIWSMIEAGSTESEMCDALQACYQADAEEIAHGVSTFLARLMNEELVATEVPSGDRPAPGRVAAEIRRPFRPPVLNAYRDMQDMLSLDPIHDVEAAGWPVPRIDDDSAMVPDSAS